MLNVFPKQGKNINYSLPITLQKKEHVCADKYIKTSKDEISCEW